jgi:hypothetical protein
MTHRKLLLSTFFRFGMLLAMVLPVAPTVVAGTAEAAAPSAPQGVAPAAPLATTNTIALSVVSARSEQWWGAPAGDPNPPGIDEGDPITQYRFIINEDNTGDPWQARYPDCSRYTDASLTVVNAAYPADCNWPSIAAVASSSPIVTQGDDSILSEATNLTLPDGKYLISVIADGFRIDGQWFTLPMEESALGSGVATVNVAMQPLPLPTATARIRVFEDNALPNSAPDPATERGLAGFAGHIGDWGGEITTDIYGNPLCTEYQPGSGPNGYAYDADGLPIPIEGTGGHCLSDANGDIVIPNLGTNRFEAWVVPPDGTNWVETTTLEGNKGWDTWLMEGDTGFDKEFVQAGEPFPFTIFGFIQETNELNDTTQTGAIQGVVAAAEVYVPFNGGLPYQGNLWGGLSGAKIARPIAGPWIALSDLLDGDRAVWVGKGELDGSFYIPNVPDGDYQLTYWDEQNLYILDLVQVSVKDGQVVDMGVLFLTGWFTRIEGHVFIDDNENGRMDPGEHGLEGYPLVMRRRENTEMDRGAIAVLTEPGGTYLFENTYPLNQWIVLEAYTDNYYVTGITFQASNQPEEATILGNGVDVGIMPVIGQSGRIDWGIKAYAPGTNGGIAGTVFYDTTRNELDPALAAVEPWSPGIAGLRLNLYATVPCDPNSGIACDPSGQYQIAADGSLAKGALLNWTETEQYERPKNCQPRDVNGNPVDHLVYPPATGDYDCLEGMSMGTQFQAGFATLDGNYGFGDILTDTNGAPLAGPAAIPPGDYLVEVEIPNDAWGRPLYQVEREEDINVFDGATWVPQIPPSACAGALHTVDVAGVGTDGPDAVYNPAFADAGGSPYEGLQRPLCDMKLVTVSEGRSIAPSFTFFTEVPIPGRHWGIILDDLTLSTNPQDLLFGEKAGVPNAPIGIYDYTNRLVLTIDSDPNGYFQALLPSTTSINCPAPSGVCGGMYRYVGNDPGQPGSPNPNYSPQYRTIAAPFEVWPGVTIPADLAPTQVAVSILPPGSQFNAPATCQLDPATPQLFAVDKVLVTKDDRTLTLTGTGFGAAAGEVFFGTKQAQADSWTDQQIVVQVPNSVPDGPAQMYVKAANGQVMVNSLTIHALGNNYDPTLFEVGTGFAYSTIQAALDAAAGMAEALIIVHPGTAEQWNPLGAYEENIVIHSPVKLQGFGPGGVYGDGTPVYGSVINGGGFGGDTQIAQDWRALVAGLNWVGNQTVYEGAVISIFAGVDTPFDAGFDAAIDGFAIAGGDQQGFPAPGQIHLVQGGGIYVNGHVPGLRITNNVLQNNGGTYGGAIRLGTPDLLPDDPNKDAQNYDVHIAHNQILANGGVNLAGGIGLFEGSDGYEIAYNDLCGNFSAEYGGAISHYGNSPGGSIHNNRIYFNRSYDEGGAIMIAGELTADPASVLSPGAGGVDIYSNIIQANLANDDGGGIRFLMAGDFAFNVYNNFIVNNVSTHEGGGISLNDAPDVRVYNNTIMKNLTTATAVTSNGQPAPAGLSTTRNSALLQATLPDGAPAFSHPLLFNNIFWDNRAGSWDGAGIAGIGLAGDPNPITYWDLGLSDETDYLSLSYSIVQTMRGAIDGGNNLVNQDPLVVAAYDTSVQALPWRTNPHFVGVILVAVDLPPNLMGDYHLQDTSPADNAGTSGVGDVDAPGEDIDGDNRAPGSIEIGADELGANSAFLTVIPGAYGKLARSLYLLYMPLITRQ